MPFLEMIGPVAGKLHLQFKNVFYFSLPVVFLFSIALAWFRGPNNGPDFFELTKRLVVAALLMACFKELTDTILNITNALANSIGSMDGLDNYLEMALKKTRQYSFSSMLSGGWLFHHDLLIAGISIIVLLVTLALKSVIVAVFHFTWLFLIIISPLLLLFHLISPSMTLNLFKTLFEVASWKVVWAILSAMLTALPFGSPQPSAEAFMVLFLMNIVIGLALILTPLIVKGLVGQSFTAVSSAISPMAMAFMTKTPKSLATQYIRNSVYRPSPTQKNARVNLTRPIEASIKSNLRYSKPNTPPPKTNKET